MGRKGKLMPSFWKKVRTALMLAALVAVASGCGGPEGAAEGGADGVGDSAASGPSWLYVAQADGESAYDASAATLSMPLRRVLAFTDRPYRDTRQLTPSGFEALWDAAGDDSFAVDPPNAVLTFWDPSQQPAARSVVCELVGPPAYDLRSSTMTVRLRVIDPAGASIPSVLHDASLFVDSSAGPCANSDDFEAVQWFNMENFDQNYGVDFYVGDNTWYASALCSDQPLAPADLDVRVSQPDTPGTYTGCGSGDGAVAIDLSRCTSTLGERDCTLQVTAVNTATGAVYSRTEVTVTPNVGSVYFDLEPAASPPCS